MAITIGEAVGGGDLGDLTPAGSEPNGTTDPAGAAPTAAPPVGRGELLEETDPKRVCEEITNLWKAQDTRYKPWIAQWDANKLTVAGIPGVRVVYDPVSGMAWARVPHGSVERTGPSKTWELIEKITATLLADGPVPDAEPMHDADSYRSAAELLTLILKNEQKESGLNLEKRAAMARLLAGTHGSAYDVFTVDPTGGGYAAMEVEAHPAAVQYDDQHPESVLIDPATGEKSDTYLRRYVMPDGTLAASPVGARRQWNIGLRAQRKTGRNLRLLPQTAPSLERAIGMIVADAMSFGDLCALFPAVRDLSPEEQIKLISWRPVSLRQLIPREVGIVGDGKDIHKSGPNNGRPTDQAIAVVFSLYYTSHWSYPNGAYIAVAGGEMVLCSREQLVIVGEGEDAREERLMLPAAQCIAYDDPEEGNPCGMGDAEYLGPTDEVRQQVMAGILDRAWQLNNRNVFADVSSSIDPGQLALRDGTAILTDLRAGQPVWEDVPPIEPELLELYGLLGGEMNSRTGLEASAQGVASPDVKSGIHAQQVVEQALVALTMTKRNLDSFIVRSWRVVAQLLRCYASTPQLLRYPDEGGAFKVREWRNTDIASTKDVSISRGTGTMLTRTAKQNLAQNELELAIQAGDIAGGYARYLRATTGNVNTILGLEEDPHRQRIRRQISEWMKGPPEMQANQIAAGGPGAQPGSPMGPSGPLAQIAQALGAPQGAQPGAPPAPPMMPNAPPMQEAA